MFKIRSLPDSPTQQHWRWPQDRPKKTVISLTKSDGYSEITKCLSSNNIKSNVGLTELWSHGDNDKLHLYQNKSCCVCKYTNFHCKTEYKLVIAGFTLHKLPKPWFNTYCSIFRHCSSSSAMSLSQRKAGACCSWGPYKLCLFSQPDGDTERQCKVHACTYGVGHGIAVTDLLPFLD